MKKLLLSLAVGSFMLGGFASQAAETYPDLYVRGANFGWGAPPAAAKLTCDESTGIYTLNADKISGNFKIATVKAGTTDGWDDSYNFGGSTKPTPISMDQDYTLINGNGGGDLQPVGNWTNVTLTFNINTKNLRVTGESAPSTVVWELHGQFVNSGWGSTDMTESDGVWSCTLTPTVAEGNFGVREMTNGGQTAWRSNTSATLSETNPELNMVNDGGNTQYKLSTDKAYTFTWNPETRQLKITWEGAGPNPNPDPEPTYPENLYLVGNLPGQQTEWDPSKSLQLTKGAEDYLFSGEATLVDSSEGFGFFRFAEVQGTWSEVEKKSQYGATDNDLLINDNTEVTLVKGTNTFKIAAGTYIFNVDLKNLTLKAVKKGDQPNPDPDPEPTYPENLYLVGNLPGQQTEWDPSQSLQLTKGAEAYLFSGEATLVDASEGYSFFRFADVQGDWTAVDAGTQYGASENDLLINDNTEVTLVKGTNTFKIAAGKYMINVDLKNLKLKAVKTGDVPGLEPTYPEKMYLIGSVNNGDWAADNGVEFVNEGDGMYSLDNVDINGTMGTSDAYFSFTEKLGANSEDWDNMGQRYGSEADPTVLEFNGGDVEKTIQKGTNPFKTAAGNYSILLDLNNMSMLISQNSVAGPTDVTADFDFTTAEKAAALIPGFTSWTDEMQKNEPTGAKYFLVDGVDIVSNGVTLKVASAEGATPTQQARVWIKANGEGTLRTYAAGSNSSTLSFTAPAGSYFTEIDIPGIPEGLLSLKSPEATLVTDGMAKAVAFTTNKFTATMEDEVSNVVFNAGKVQIKTISVKYAKPSAIEGVDAEIDNEAEAIYFNLQGVRVANPTKGIFIRVAGSKSSKVYIK